MHGVLIWLWAQRKETFEGGGGVIFVHRREQSPTVCSLGGVLVSLESVGGMVSMNPLDREGNHSGHFPRRPGGDRGARSSGGTEAEAKDNCQGDENPGERWFH